MNSECRTGHPSLEEGGGDISDDNSIMQIYVIVSLFSNCDLCARSNRVRLPLASVVCSDVGP